MAQIKLKMEVFYDVTPCSLVPFYHTTWCYNPQNCM